MEFVNENRAQVVSLVPSWTETLIWAGVDVIGRTRFCVHPVERVNSISALGGTKGIDLKRLIALKPDYVVLDQEENKKETADQLLQSGIKILVSHVSDFKSASAFLEQLGEELQSDRLLELSRRYLTIPKLSQDLFLKNILIEGTWDDLKSDRIEYVIWKNPYMVIGKNTFIDEVLKKAGLFVQHNEKYPVIEEGELKQSFCFFSSEPFPFASEYAKLIRNGFKGALVDGEKISWYGIRNLNFLEGCVG